MNFTNQNQTLQISVPQLYEAEIELLQYPGPSIGIFATNNVNSLGIKKQYKKQCISSEIIIVQKQINYKIRSMIYCLLHSIYQNEYNDSIKRIQEKFKVFIYGQKNRITILEIQQIPTKYKQFYDCNLLMKLLIEFLQVMNLTRNRGNLYNLLLKYPIIDFILNLVFRSYLIEKMSLFEYLSIKNEIQFTHMYKILIEKIELPLNKISNNQFIFQISNLKLTETQQQILISSANSLNLYNNRNTFIQQIPILNFSIDMQNQIEKVNQSFSLSNQYTPQFKTTKNIKEKHHTFMLQTQRLICKHQNQQLIQTISQGSIQQIKLNNQISFQMAVLPQQTIIKQKQQQKKIRDNIKAQFQQIFEVVGDNSHNKRKNRLYPTIEATNNDSEYNFHDGLTGDQVLKFMSPKTIKQMNSKKQQFVRLIYPKKQDKKQIIKQKIKNFQKKIEKKKAKKYSAILTQQLQYVLNNTTNNIQKRFGLTKIQSTKTQKKTQYTKTQQNDSQTNNTFRLSHKTQQASFIQTPKPKASYYSPLTSQIIPNFSQFSRFQDSNFIKQEQTDEKMSPRIQLFTTQKVKILKKGKKMSMQLFSQMDKDG